MSNSTHLFHRPPSADDTVYIGSYDSSVYALNGTSGALKWSYAMGSDVVSSPAISVSVSFVYAEPKARRQPSVRSRRTLPPVGLPHSRPGLCDAHAHAQSEVEEGLIA